MPVKECGGYGNGVSPDGDYGYVDAYGGPGVLWWYFTRKGLRWRLLLLGAWRLHVAGFAAF